MIFVIGGQAQGKTEFTMKFCEDGDAVTADGRTSEYCEAMTAKRILHLECFVRRLMEEGKDPDEFAQELMERNRKAVIAADEIGCGIVPADAFLREYREMDGRICQKIAAFSDEVYRVVCGLGIRIK